MITRRRRYVAPTSPPSPSISDIRVKVSRVVYRHQQLKISFSQLVSEIRTGLQETEDVFASLAIPLMKLVGLKTSEMAEEGKFSIIIFDDSTHFHADSVKQNRKRCENGADQRHDASGFEIEEKSYMNRAKTVSKELVQKQHGQLMQLVDLLRRFEAQVNASQTNVLQTLNDHQTSIQKVFKKAGGYVSTIHQRGENNSAALTVKLLQHIFHAVVATLRSIGSGMNNLVDELARKMSSPLVNYVKGLKHEVESGRNHPLLRIVEEMGGAIRTGRIELEELRKRDRVAEHKRREALYLLNRSEETARKYQGLPMKGKNRSEGQFEQDNKLVVKDQDHAKEDNLLWELLKKKRKLGMGNESSKPCGLSLSQLSPQTPRLGLSSSPLSQMSQQIPQSGPSPSSMYSSNGKRLLPIIPLGSSPSSTYLLRNRKK